MNLYKNNIMFSGIIKNIGILSKIEPQNSNLLLTFDSSVSKTLAIDQSVAHNGICLTIIEQNDHQHKVCVVFETRSKTAIQYWEIGMNVNLELSLRLNGFVDGHLVYGHIDTTSKCIAIMNNNGSWLLTFEHFKNPKLILLHGSIIINGVCLTVARIVNKNQFVVSIIPYTFTHTTFQFFKIGDIANIEFDIIGKYLLHFQDC